VLGDVHGDGAGRQPGDREEDPGEAVGAQRRRAEAEPATEVQGRRFAERGCDADDDTATTERPIASA
jgi:hypothetical protein